jgi:hypothetical protein
MSKATLVNRIITILQDNLQNKLTSKVIAEHILEYYPLFCENKLNSSFKLKNQKDLFNQLTTEISSVKPKLIKRGVIISKEDKTTTYRLDKIILTPQIPKENSSNSINITTSIDVSSEDIVSKQTNLLEHDLYPLLMKYLKNRHNLLSMRINESKSTNSKGRHGNKWLHPDIVSMERVDNGFHNSIKKCFDNGGGNRIRLWSFEVKIKLNRSNIRESFFQAVSNSSWANEGYLVASSIDDKILDEVKMLSSLHGIGLILLNIEDPDSSQILFQSKPKVEVDWLSIDRIIKENRDFSTYIGLVATYYNDQSTHGWPIFRN